MIFSFLSFTPTDYSGYCPETCNDLYNPVCGNDGKLYINRCKLLEKACVTNNDWLDEDIFGLCMSGMFSIFYLNLHMKS